MAITKNWETWENYPEQKGREILLTGKAWEAFQKWLRSQIPTEFNIDKEPPADYEQRPGEWLFISIAGSWTNWAGVELFIKIALIKAWFETTQL